MSRFSQLEFGERQKPKGETSAGEPIRDELFFGQRALTAWLSGDFEEALRNYSRALEKNNAYYDGWFGQVRMLIELREYDEALLWADKALELFPEHPELLAAKAVACVRDADYSKGLAYSDNSMGKPGVTAFVWLARAEVLLAYKSRVAETCIRNAVGAAQQGSGIIRLLAGRMLLRNGNAAEALDHLGAALKDMPRAPLAWYELGRAQALLGLSEAAVTLNEAAKLRPGWDPPLVALREFQSRGPFSVLRGWCRRLRGRK